MKPAWLGLFLVLLALVVFSNAYPGAFHFDDWPLLLENPEVTGSTFNYRFFLTHYGGRPLTLLSFRWNYLLSGANSAGFLLVNLFLHLTAVVAVFLLILEVGRKRTLAFLSGAVFAVHPLQTQPVNYVWSRSVLLMADFGVLSLLLIRRRPWLALLSFQLAIWSRAEALALLPLLLLLAPDRWKPFSLLAGVNGGAFLLGLFLTAPAEVAWKHPDVVGYWTAQPVMFWKYVGLMVWPAGLSIDHDPGPYSWVLKLLALLGLVVALAVLVGWARRYRAWFFAGLWLMVPFVPTWVIPNSDLFNESRAYLSLGGAGFLAGLVLSTVFRRRPQLAGIAGIVLILALAVATVDRNQVWEDEVGVWLDAVSKNPLKARAHYNLGSALAREGFVDRAERAFNTARRLNPRDDMSYAALGYCAELRGDWSAAERLFQKALDLNPGNQYAQQGYLRSSGRSSPEIGAAGTVEKAAIPSPGRQ